MPEEPTQIAPNPVLALDLEFLEGRAPMPIDEQKDYERLFVYSKAEGRLKSLIGDWDPLREEAEQRREVRNIEVDIKALRLAGDLEPDATILPIRVIDENIRKEKPAYINFLKQSRRLCVFVDEKDKAKNTERIENEFTRVNTFLKWAQPFERCLDGAQLHGWDQVEIEVDTSKPGGLSVSHIGHDNLLFQVNAKDLEDCEEILRRYDLTLARFESMATRVGFDPVQTERILTRFREKERDAEDITIYKRFFKFRGQVFVCWFADASTAEEGDNWLRLPQPLLMGEKEQVPELGFEENEFGVPQPVRKMVFRDVQESSYPVKQFFYLNNEEPRIVDRKGRYFLDKAKQDAQTSMWSSYINALHRSSYWFASVENATDPDGPLKILENKLRPGAVYNKKVAFWSMDPPDPEMLRAANQLDVRTAAEQGDIASSVINRKDTRKTAEEIKAAEVKQVSMASVPIGNYSDFLTDSWQTIWRIQRSLALENAIIFLAVEVAPDVEINDIEVIKRGYIIKASGDIDVVQRQEKLQKRFNVWPLVAQTPVAPIFMLDMLKEMFPEDASKYEQALAIGQQKDMMIMNLRNILGAAMQGDNGELRPEFQEFAPQLQMIDQQLAAGAQAQKQKGEKIA